MFWLVMTVVASTAFVSYAIIGAFGSQWGVSHDRARKFARASWLALGWTAVCVGHYALG